MLTPAPRVSRLPARDQASYLQAFKPPTLCLSAIYSDRDKQAAKQPCLFGAGNTTVLVLSTTVLDCEL